MSRKTSKSVGLTRVGDFELLKGLAAPLITKQESRILSAAVEVRDQPNDEDLTYMARELVQCTLPHSDPGRTAAQRPQFQQRLANRLTAMASYTLAKSLDNLSNESDLKLQAVQLNPKVDRGASDFDIRQTLTAAFAYTIPVQQRWKMLRPITNGWGLDGVLIARSATPVNVTFSSDLGFGLTDVRPDLVAGVPLYLADAGAGGGQRFNPAAFAIQQDYPGRQGTLGRNVMRGFPLWQMNLTARREFRIYEGLKLQFRAEMFNIVNHPTFADPTGSLYSPQFGLSTQMLAASLGRGGANGGLNPLYQVGGPRSIQLALRMVF